MSAIISDNKSLKKKIIIIISVVLLVVIASLVVFLLHRPVEIEMATLIEATNITPLNDEQITNINRYLSSLQIENDDAFGFIDPADTRSSANLETALGIVSLASSIPEYDMGELSDKLQFLCRQNPDTLDILNLVYLAILPNP